MYMYVKTYTHEDLYIIHKSITYICIYVYIYLFPSSNFLAVSQIDSMTTTTTTTTYWVTATLPPCKRVPNCPEGTKRLVLLEPARDRRDRPPVDGKPRMGSWDVSIIYIYVYIYIHKLHNQNRTWEFRRIYGHHTWIGNNYFGVAQL